MKTLLLSGAAALALGACATTPAPEIAAAPPAAPAAAPVETAMPMPANPLLQPFAGPFDGVPAWDQYKAGQFAEAFDYAIKAQQADIDAIVANKDTPTFDNTIVALEKSGQLMEQVGSIFGVYSSNLATPEVQAIDAEWSPKISAAYDRITLDDGLFQRIKTLYEKRADLGLDAKQQRLLTRTYDSFVRRGALLDAAGKAQLVQYNQDLAKAFTDFSAHLLADEGKTTMATAAEMAGVPDDVKNAAAAAAKAAGHPAGHYLIKNTRSMVDPILTFGTNRGLREKLWREFVGRGDNGDANDNNAVIARIVKLRADRAHLLGYKTHADWRMQDTMAKTPANAMDLMMKVWPAAVARVHQEVADMKPLAARDGIKSFQPWDYLYYQEKVRKAKYDLSQDEIKPYFQLDKLVQGMMWSAEQLYDLKFTENTGTVPVFDPDVRTFAVTNAKTGAPIGLYYLDTYARDGKRSGAWATGYRDTSRLLGDRQALVSNNNNFNKPAPGQPVLVSLDDASTLFHEFGHAIHGFLTDVYYPSLGGSQRDFVEYPSQVNENWLLTRPVLDKFALHYQTGKPMPAALVKKIEASESFGQGYATVSYLSSALVDMMLHTKEDGVVDVDSFEKDALAKLGMPREMVMRHRLPQFGHLFSSDSYSAGYYSYLWSETMDADTWAAFKDVGNPFDRTLADRFRTVLLATGNETDRAEAYRAFRGRDPDVKALLERRGFPTN